MIYGSIVGITDDGDYNIIGQNLIDLEAKGITWKVTWRTIPAAFVLLFGLGRSCNFKANQAAAVLYGTPVKPPTNHQDSTPYNNYSFIAAVEKNWYLGCLKNDYTYIC
ncbi:hypothetical protein F8M41_012796 [Gigaspora margarita]|uniref:Uncharacterized protein n=1 Tax=Gigaspora margarita TaxID=4874 RepID=A0A8H4B3W2_GIGMA|nr:hypothetical protein F8M41_012796 [Gigaspora margarita]